MGRLTSLGSISKKDLNPYSFYGITYETDCNILTYNYSRTVASGTIIRYRTPSNLNEALPTILKIGDIEKNMGMLLADKNYEYIMS